MKENNIVKVIKPNKFFGEIKKLLDTNAPTLATFGSILGVVATVYFMHRAAKNAAKVEEKYEEDLKYIEADLEDDHGNPATEDDIKAEKTKLKIDKYLRLVYIYRFALLSGIGSAGFAVLSNYLNGRTIAMMGTLLATNADKLQKLGEKAKEMVGEEKFQELKESVEKEMFAEKLQKGEVKAEKAKVITKEGAEPDEGFTRFYVPWNGEMLDVPEDRVKDAINEASRVEFLDWNTFKNMLGYESAPVWYKFCWTKDNPFKAHIGYVNMGSFGMKAICVDTEPEINKYSK
jgi:hypothetical protein